MAMPIVLSDQVAAHCHRLKKVTRLFPETNEFHDVRLGPTLKLASSTHSEVDHEPQPSPNNDELLRAIARNCLRNGSWAVRWSLGLRP